MEIGVAELERIPAGTAGAAGGVIAGRSLAEQKLPEPESESLLPDAAWSVDEKCRGKGVAAEGSVQSLAKRGVSEQWGERHPELWGQVTRESTRTGNR